MAITTILLDLDNTLLGNPMSVFLPAYFEAAQSRFSQSIDPQNLREAMIAAVHTTQSEQSNTKTNLERFITDFARRLELSVETIRQILEIFYREDYPALQKYTSLRPEAVEIVEYLQSNGYKTVIATNPLFPTIAIEQRLAWAGLSNFSFDLVTTMDNSHFIKPHLGYYQEILATVGSSPQSSLMVGDDPQNDIIPAVELGIKSWWVTDEAVPKEIRFTYNKKGTLLDFLNWLQTGGLSNNSPSTLQ